MQLKVTCASTFRMREEGVVQEAEWGWECRSVGGSVRRSGGWSVTVVS